MNLAQNWEGHIGDIWRVLLLVPSVVLRRVGTETTSVARWNSLPGLGRGGHRLTFFSAASNFHCFV